jgi:predicted phosphoribosyltransferase
MRIGKRLVKKMAKELDVDLDLVSVDDLIEGMNVELEHGYISPRTNVTNNDLFLTLKIALAHFEESGPDYYKELKKLEKKLNKKWKNKTIFLN